jgi:hypothetical protein
MRPWSATAALILTLALVSPHDGGAQSAGRAAPATDSSQTGAVRVFLDCQSSRCDFDFMRDQIRWVNWVRDRLVADVQLLVTSLATGSGGSEFTINAIGMARYRGKADTAVVFIPPNESDDTARRSLARTFSLLLAPYAAKTALASRLTLSYNAPATVAGTSGPVRDPWNFWVYRVGANGFANGEKQSNFRYVNLSTSANRVTEAWRISLNANLGYDESRFDLGEDGQFVNLQRNYGLNTLAVKSLGQHWSAGMTANVSHSDYFNQDVVVRIAPAVEYNFFPYREFTRRQLTAYYSLGVSSFRYRELTIFERDAETRPVQNATINWSARQPWGNVNLNLFGTQYLHDLRRYNYGAGGNINLRITKGLSVNFGGNYSRVADQLYLRKGALDDNQIIARQQALATNYRYFGNFGVSYTFGSIYNTIVNPRFGSSRGGENF